MNSALAQRVFLIRTLLLVFASSGATFGLTSLSFKSGWDLRVEVLVLAMSVFAGAIGGWFLIVRPMSRLINVDFGGVQRDQELRAIQASKMSTLGEMSAGIAHEINNPLAIIVGKTEAMRTAMSAPVLNRELMNRHIETMERTAARIARIVNALRTFSRDGDSDPFEVTNVSQILDETVALCGSRFLNHGIELHVTKVPIEFTIDARAVQISQVLLNLLSNAFDAVSVLDEKWVRLEVRSNGRHIEFVVTDSGNGIPEAIRAKLTQPFFTTKEIGVGTGLGLSIASGIVLSHRGTLEVDETSSNTCFVVRLPRAESTISAA